jgi:dimethylargininase
MLIALTRAVPASLDRCELTHLARSPVDVPLAVRQHADYEEALRRAGCTVIRLPPEPDLPDSVFVEDTAVVLDEVAVTTRPGAPSRRGETVSAAAALRAWRRLGTIEEPGTLDGGDVLAAGKTIYVGVGARSNPEGVRQLAAHLAPFGYEVRGVEVSGCLHLKSAATLVSPSAVLVNPSFVDPRRFEPLEPVLVASDEPAGANALLVGGHVIYSPAYPRTRDILESLGARIITVDLGELAKAEGALTCCSLVFEGAPAPGSSASALGGYGGTSGPVAYRRTVG